LRLNVSPKVFDGFAKSIHGFSLNINRFPMMGSRKRTFRIFAKVPNILNIGHNYPNDNECRYN